MFESAFQRAVFAEQAAVQSPHPQLADLVNRFYQPTDAESQRIGGKSRASFEARAARAEHFLEQLAEIDRESLDLADRIDYDYFRAQVDNSLQKLRDIRLWQKRPGDYIPFDGFFAARLERHP